MSLESVNPATGETVKTYDQMADDQVDEIIGQAHQAFCAWREQEFEQRASYLHRTAQVLRDRQSELAQLMTREMGKTLVSGKAEVEKCAWACEYYAQNAQQFLSAETIDSDASRSKVVYQPLGVVLAVMPWNFPLWQVFRFAAPGLMAGNAAVLKHASNVSGCALAIEQVFHDAGLPDNLFRTLLISSDKVARVLENPAIKAATLTGSTAAGRAIAAKAGAMLKKTVLELGGSDPYIVLADANLDQSVKSCVTSRLINAGQSCIAAKRFIVEQAVLDEFTEKFVAAMAAKRMGDPLEDDTDFGPQARLDLRDELHRQVRASIDQGANLLLGGSVPAGPGAYYPATVLSEVKPGMPAYDEETFGPVAAIISARDVADAVRIANDTNFGLGAAIFTGDDQRGENIAEHELQAGCCFVNSLVKSDPRLPFGGIGDSGYGRELSHHGIHEFVNAKTVYVS